VFAVGYLAPFRCATRGSSWYLWRPSREQPRPFAPGAALAGPTCTTWELFVAVGPDSSPDGRQYLRAYDAEGIRAWETEVPRVVAATGLSSGNIAVTCAPTQERWEHKRAFQRVEDECRVFVLGPDGEILHEHAIAEPPAAMAAHADDLIYVVTRSSLSALASA
jgi:hypothetical protein